MFGPSGSGKTTIAHEYAYFKKEQPDGNDFSVQFIDCSSSLYSNLLNIKTRLGINKNNVINHKEDDLLMLIKCKIDTFEKNFIFILDNVEYLDDVRKFLNIFVDDNHQIKHKFIITTKNHQLFPNWQFQRFGIEIKPFNETKCFEYLEKSNKLRNRLKNDNDDDEWKAVFLNNEVLPKDLELLVNNFEDQQTNCNMYELKRFLFNESNTRYAILKLENPNGYEVLKHLAFLKGSSIDPKLIEDLIFNDYLGDEEFEVTLNKLLKSTYLRKKTDINTQECLYEIHESTQIEVKLILNEEIHKKEKANILNSIVRSLNDSLKKLKIPNLEELKCLSEHVLSIKNENWETKFDYNENLISLYQNIAKMNSEYLFDYETSRIFLEEIVKIIKSSSNRPISYPRLEDILDALGLVYHKNGDFKNALRNYTQALQLKKCNNEKRVSMGSTLNNMGILYRDKREFNHSLTYFNEALQIFRDDNKCASENLQTTMIANTLTNIGVVYVEIGNFKDALTSYAEALQIQKENCLSANDSSIAEILSNMGMVYSELGKLDAALKSYNEALQIYKQIYPDSNHSSIADILSNMARVYSVNRDHENALKSYRDSLEVRKAIYAAHHGSIADTLYEMGNIKRDLNELEQSLEYYWQSMYIYKKTNHSNFSNALDQYLPIQKIVEGLFNLNV